MRKLCLKTSLSTIVIILLIFLGAYLRLRSFGQFPGFLLSEQGRDLLVAKHMAKGWGSLSVSPYAAVGGEVTNSPLYYWVLAGAYFVGGKHAVSLVFQASGLLFLLFIYLCGKTLFGQRVGIIALFLSATSAALIRTSAKFWQPNLLPTISVISLYCVLKFLDHHKRRYIFMAYSLLLVGALIHHSMIVLPMALSLFLILFNLRQKRKYNFFPLMLFLAGLALIYFGLSFGARWPGLGYKNPFADGPVWIPRMSLVIEHMTKVFFDGDISAWVVSLPWLFILIFFLSAFFCHRQYRGAGNSLRWGVFFLFFLLILKMLFSVVLLHESFIHYYLPEYPALILLAAYFVGFLSNKVGLVLPIIILLVFVYHTQKPSQFFSGNVNATYADNLLLAEKVLGDADRYNYQIGILYTYFSNRFDRWDVGSFWFAAEEIKGKKLVDIVDSKIANNNISPKGDPVVDYYFYYQDESECLAEPNRVSFTGLPDGVEKLFPSAIKMRHGGGCFYIYKKLL